MTNQKNKTGPTKNHPRQKKHPREPFDKSHHSLLGLSQFAPIGHCSHLVKLYLVANVPGEQASILLGLLQ